MRRSRWGVGPPMALVTGVWTAVALAVHWFWYPTFAVPSGLRWAFRACGAGLLGVGVPVYLALAVYFSRRSRRGDLVRTGPYARVRHPLYALWVFILTPGAVLLVGSWLLLSVPVVMYVAARALVPREEAELEERYGESFREYRRRSGRLIPRFRRRGPLGERSGRDGEAPSG